MRHAAVFLLAAMLLAMPAAAESDMAGELGIDELENSLPAEAAEIYGSLEADSGSFGEKLSSLLDWLSEHSLPVLRSAVASALAMMAILLLSTAAQSLTGGKAPDFVRFGASLGIAAVAAGDLGSFIGLGEQTIQSLADFGALLLPCMAAAMAAAGNAASGGAIYAATALFLNLLLTLSSAVLMPLIKVYIAAVTARSALGTSALNTAVTFTKWLCVTAMTVLVVAFTTYFSVTGAIAAGGDAAAARVARTAIAAALPVVGRIVSGAAGTVVAGAAMLRSGVGVLGLLAVMAVCAAPFLTLGVHYVVYKAAAVLAEGLDGGESGKLIGGLGTAFGMVMGLVGCGAIMLFLAMVSSMKAVSPL
ncbi:MAG TPA: hypothetical protein H9689_03795 [Firmicutes bacterium]|nr:hypothetical protein [Bacillota bacterium]